MAPVRPLTLKVATRALGHLRSIENYLRARNPAAAARVGDEIRAAFEILRRRPYSGRPSPLPDAREKSVIRYPYVIVYQPPQDAPDTVVILGVFYTAQGERKI